ncbi:MAG: ATP-binding protein [Candidatus Riflebacteria bacterium]|nr:ATP-binding protein [Candidatus Riflebacteria bacterium]
MIMNTNLAGRIRNTNLPKSHGLMPLFEAVVNSIHAIEERGIDNADGLITINILRNPQQALPFNDKDALVSTDNVPEIVSFEIVDNGSGFNNANFESFQTLDSEHKGNKGCRGIGRLLWLRAFSNVEINSSFQEGNEYKQRSFCFSANRGIYSETLLSLKDAPAYRTSVKLTTFDSRYQKASPRLLLDISNALLDHCLWFFIRKEGAPKIQIVDDSKVISLHSLFKEQMATDLEAEKVSIKDWEFIFTHVKINSKLNPQSYIAYCAANRLVKNEPLKGKIPGFFGMISKDGLEYSYRCFVSSNFLDERVCSERTGFNIEEEIEGIFENTDISLKEIRESVISSLKNRLKELLKTNFQVGKERINSFVDQTAPRYRPIISKLSEEELAVDPKISNKDLELILHKKLAEFESNVISDGHKLISDIVDGDIETYKIKLETYLSNVTDIKMSDLANYVSHRKVVLDFLEMALKRTPDGKYVKEELIHRLLMPMGFDSDSVDTGKCNLWIVDERLAFHNYLASDKTLRSMPITNSTDTKEPDILALNVFDNPLLMSETNNTPLASITVIEIKRPMRNDAQESEDKDPIGQALTYIQKIRHGKTLTKSGRPIPRSESIPGYCYILADLTPTMEERCKMRDLTVTHDYIGYFGYNKNYNAYIEVISFDGLLKAAKERNRAFFDRLGLANT